MVLSMIRVRLKCLFLVTLVASSVILAGLGTHTWYSSSNHLLSEYESEPNLVPDNMIKVTFPEDKLSRAMYNPIHFNQVQELQVHGVEAANVNQDSDSESENIPERGNVTSTGNNISATDSDANEEGKSLSPLGNNLIPDASIGNKPKEKVTTAKENSPVHILIFTKRRSGSSFLGQIFNNNPDVFFQFEPLKLLEAFMNYKELQDHASDALRNIFKCNLNGTQHLIDFYNKEGLHRSSSKVLTSPPFCNLMKMDRHIVKRCPPITQNGFLNVCHQKKYSVIKIIRVVDLGSLASLISDPNLNIKIIHLVRDPRAVYNSRVQSEHLDYSFDDKQKTNMNSMCQGTRLSHEASEKYQWLKDSGQYIVMRYEDLAENPIQVAKELYIKLGLGVLPESVKMWIETNSNVNVKKTDQYSTQRNSSSIFQAWRLSLPFAVSQQIENLESCGAVLDIFGYQRTHSEKELTDINHILHHVPKSNPP